MLGINLEFAESSGTGEHREQHSDTESQHQSNACKRRLEMLRDIDDTLESQILADQSADQAHNRKERKQVDLANLDRRQLFLCQRHAFTFAAREVVHDELRWNAREEPPEDDIPLARALLDDHDRRRVAGRRAGTAAVCRTNRRDLLRQVQIRSVLALIELLAQQRRTDVI